MRQTKYLIALTTSLFAAPLLPAQVVVIDPAQIANNQANHVVDLAKYVEMVNNQLKQITTMTQELQQAAISKFALRLPYRAVKTDRQVCCGKVYHGPPLGCHRSSDPL